MRYAKTTGVDMVDSHFTDADPRVLIKSHEIPLPLYPGDDGFWAQFEYVLDRVSLAKRMSAVTGVANCIEAQGVRTFDQAAKLVHKDWPGDIMLFAAKAAVDDPETIWREFDGIQGPFTDWVVLLNRLVNTAPHWVSPSSFANKAHFLMPRPEEVAGAIARGEIDCPSLIKSKLMDTFGGTLDGIAADQRTFTMYPEGSPGHGSYWGMHPAAAGAALAIILLMLKTSQTVKSDCELCAFNVADFRAYAGVHYPMDNLTGLAGGHEAVARKLPEYAQSEIGMDADQVREYLAETKVYWGVEFGEAA